MDRQRLSRRTLLQASGALGITTLAGCSDSEPTPNETTTDGSTTTDGEPQSSGDCTPGHTAGDDPCQQIVDDAANLVQFDAAGTDLLVTFSYPCGWNTGTTDQFEDRFQANATRSGIGSGDDPTYVDVQVRTYTEPVTADYATNRTGSFQAIEYDYGGEKLEAAVSHQTGDFDKQYGANAYTSVPYEGDYYAVDLVPTVQGGLCGAEVDNLVIAMVRSLAPNEETTFTPA